MTALKVETVANLGGYMSLFSSSVPTYLYATLLSGQYALSRLIHCQRQVRSTPTPPPSTPIAALAGRRPPTWWNAWSRRRRANWASSPADLRRKNFITQSFPHQTPVIMCL